LTGPGADPRPAVEALLRHARALVGTTLEEIADGLGLPVPFGNVRTKGWPGQIIERELGAGLSDSGAPSTVRGPDFAALGVECKTVPVNAALAPLESTCVCHIDPLAIAGEQWATSYVRRKLARVLFVALLVPESNTPVGQREVRAVTLWSPSADDERLLAADFQLFVDRYFRPGRAAEIRGHVGRVMQVRPKGRNAADRRLVPGPDGAPVSLGRCGFYLRPAFVGRILRPHPAPEPVHAP
jgi:DNA mismatch repair protein MutH